MNSKRAGFLFLAVVSVSITASLGLSVGSLFFSYQLPILLNFLISEGIIIVPGVIFLLLFEKSPAELIHLKKLKVLDIPVIMLFTALLYPAIMFCNAMTMTVTDNEIASISDSILAYPWYVMLLIVGIVGPLCEEFVFRGMIYGGLRRSGRIVGALVLQAVLFGLMHMNLNQMCYAILIGIAMGILVEATGSIFASCVLHIMINSGNVILMYIQEWLISIAGMDDSVNAAEAAAGDAQLMLGLASMLLLPALVGCGLALCITVLLSARNKRSAWMSYLFLTGATGEAESGMPLKEGEYFEVIPPVSKLLHAPLIAGMIITAVMIALELLVEHGAGAIIKEWLISSLFGR